MRVRANVAVLATTGLLVELARALLSTTRLLLKLHKLLKL
jgi:hypothetical protein